MALQRVITFVSSAAMIAAATLFGLGSNAQAATSASGCTSIGGGKYNCHVWKTASTWPCTTTQRTDSCTGDSAGILYAGTNYFYCQTRGHEFRYGSYYNYYWAMTDDDSGNKRVWLPVVWISGGVNNGPIPGLKYC
ncbi:hypothetical protein G3I38_17910 [Streptomyces sp. SID7958]|uniref:Peptidase inhibitor family I36 protein n=2 Tax=unclassified Streptomyces TaxID=2593676 RepID=A0A6G3QTZ9_9ACTN|nr:MULTISPECIES: hypothetical protein [unclassified Streptomyces]NEA86667.1 hypothetical protein [Streptomyces sp. SID14436]NEC81058.1 hypothetical protein [Streptomyces sp. SID7958]